MSSTMRVRSNSRNHYTSTNSLKRNSSYGTLPGKMNFGNSFKTTTPGLQKQLSVGQKLPPKSGTTAVNNGDANQNNTMSFEYYIRN